MIIKQQVERLIKIEPPTISPHYPQTHAMNKKHTHIDFIHKLATLQANFFLSLTDFCINELNQRIPSTIQFSTKQDNHVQTPPQQIYKHQQSKLPQQEAKSPPQTKKPQQQKKERKKKGRPRTKPLFAMHKPKAPTSSYLLYLHDHKAEISNKYKLNCISEVTKVASEEWKKMAEEQKQQYYKKSEELKARYREEMQVYREKYAQEIKEEKKKRQCDYKSKWTKKKKMEKHQEKPVTSSSGQSSSHSYQRGQRPPQIKEATTKSNTVIELDNNQGQLNQQQDSLQI